jgi:DNA modification methylase
MDMSNIASLSVDLVVTSPPYPMIKMWDDMFISYDKTIRGDILSGDGKMAFEKMHTILDIVWSEVDRVLKPGGICCINIGDATRNIRDCFSLYPSHSRIINYFYHHNFYSLPEVLWYKPTNSPTKYMGSGMLPVGAYITLEHEYILIFKKGNSKREFKTELEKNNRMKSAIFWEERNTWFSNIWTILGAKQKISKDGNHRERSAAYPFEIPYRLINMFSVKGDTVLDPFLGLGTTTLAAMVSNRNSIGFEIVKELEKIIEKRISNVIDFGNEYILNRLRAHEDFILKLKKPTKYLNKYYKIPVISRQEIDIMFDMLSYINNRNSSEFALTYNTDLFYK